MKAIKIVGIEQKRDISFRERHTEAGKTSRPIIGDTKSHIVVEIEGHTTLWKLRVPAGFLQELGEGAAPPAEGT